MEDKRPYWKEKVHEIIFGHHTKAGRWFDVSLLIVILLSVAVLMLDSVKSIDDKYGDILGAFEWAFTILFTIEYILRIMTAKNPKKYATSFFGIIDLISIIPTYLSIFLVGTHFLTIVRTFRLLRVFRILGLSTYVGQASALGEGLLASKHKIIVFLGAVISVNIFIGTLMYLIEGADNGFTSIPRSIYWAIVTMTTVGYGDIAPQTPLGQSIAAFAMIIAYSIIAVPTSIVTLNIKEAMDKQKQAQKKEEENPNCPNCHLEIDDDSSKFCRHCGHKF